MVPGNDNRKGPKFFCCVDKAGNAHCCPFQLVIVRYDSLDRFLDLYAKESLRVGEVVQMNFAVSCVPGKGRN